MKKPALRLPWLAAASLAAAFLAGVHPGAATVTMAAEPAPEEIEITGQRQRYMLERQVQAAEDEVYALYNQLNTDDLYDIHCRWEKPLGTNMRYRLCRPEFLDRATRARGQEFYDQIAGTGMSSALPIEVEYARRLPLLKAKLETTAANSPELAQTMKKFLALKSQLEERLAAASAAKE
jgi:hypothetical protein